MGRVHQKANKSITECSSQALESWKKNQFFSCSSDWAQIPTVNFVNDKFVMVTTYKTRPWSLATHQNCESQNSKGECTSL